jgi:hypothetical protein
MLRPPPPPSPPPAAQCSTVHGDTQPIRCCQGCTWQDNTTSTTPAAAAQDRSMSRAQHGAYFGACLISYSIDQTNGRPSRSARQRHQIGQECTIAWTLSASSQMQHTTSDLTQAPPNSPPTRALASKAPTQLCSGSNAPGDLTCVHVL